MPNIGDIRDFLEDRVPSKLKMDFDNVGLLVGDENQEVLKVLVSLDITEAVVDEAVKYGAKLIISHHPITFGVKNVISSDPTGRKIISLIRNEISAICLHTNLDVVYGGVNDALIRALGGHNCKVLDCEQELDHQGIKYGMGRIGTLSKAVELREFLDITKKALCANGLRYYDSGRPVKKIGVVGGAGADYIELAASKGCDTYVTSDIKYHQFMSAADYGINLIDADHYCTENVVVPVICDMVREGFPEVIIKMSEVHKQTAEFF